jgi:hypothetical protein
VNNLLANQIALNDSVIKAWDEIVDRHKHRITAASAGGNSVAGLRKSLYPIREALRSALEVSISTIPAYSHLKIYLSPFWQMGQKGALFKGYIWNALAPDRALTRGRLQITFCPNQDVRSEYVAYKVTQSGRSFHIENLSRWIKNDSWFKEFRLGCEQLPAGFRLECVCNNDSEISNYIPNITSQQWAALHTYGLKTENYFVLSYDRPREILRHLTVPEFAELITTDFAVLSGLYPLLQGARKVLGNSQAFINSPVVSGTVRKSTPPISTEFNPEFFGDRAEYKISGSVKSRRIHGIVINTLSEELERRGFKVANNQALDIYILNSRNKITHLFEAKTDAKTSSLYSAVGQLMLNGAALDSKPHHILVIPEQPPAKKLEILGRLGVDVIIYKLVNDKVQFMSLDQFVLSSSS